MTNARKARRSTPHDRTKTKTIRSSEHRLCYRLRRRIRFTSRKATRAVNDMHQKLSSWLAANYKQVLLPSFHTSEMVRRHFLKAAADATPKNAAVQKRKIRSPTARAMLGQAHYRFKMLLKYKMERLGLPEVSDWKRFLWDEVTVPAMKTYRSMHGDLLMPVSFTVPKDNSEWPRSTWGYKLGYWTSELRRNKDKLLQYQLQDLQGMDFSWNAREAHWNRYFAPAMQRYKELHGGLQVPQSFVVPSDANWPKYLGGYRLGQKVNNLRCGEMEEIQEIELIYKSWMLLETLHEVVESNDEEE
ncbi:hypothetical protein PHMEG_0003731 [Phytophthora megakarya]|uniref:Uncharacterized protein n=1 Tax=Phytophthora megakarya TaxID=4795 RepID=A0A225WVP3_9STRA|nr:hypothetical protein PHMEG_0003731 [Phytophthora megakarya]